MASRLNRIWRALSLVEDEPAAENSNQPQKVQIHYEELGSSGIANYSGYYSEEYLQELRGRPAADLWDKMRRSDAKIQMVLKAVKSPIKGAHWFFKPGEQGNPEYTKHAELMEQIFFRDLPQSWTQQLSEILTKLDFGYSLFEIIHKPVLMDPKFGNYLSLGKLAWRSPRTIERWNLDPKTGGVVSVTQYAYGDLQRQVDIDGKFLVVFTNDREGDNYEGVSALRPCYGPWKRKNVYQKLMAIGIEKFAVPTPAMEVPDGKEDTKEYQNAKKILKNFVSHQQQFIMYPKGWPLTWASPSNFDASKIQEAINKENAEIASAFLVNFLELGQQGSGSYALSNDLSDFMLQSLEHIAQDICEVINRTVVRQLVDLNFGPQRVYPELVASGIKDKPGKELAELLKALADGKLITPDADLEANIREKYGLPEREEIEVTPPAAALPAPANTAPAVQAPASTATAVSTTQLAEVIALADKPKTPKALMTAREEDLRKIMQEMLGDVGKGVIGQLMAKKKKATPSEYLTLTNQVVPKGSRDYRDELQQFLSEVSQEAIAQARKEIPGTKTVQLSESMKLASVFADLPPEIQRKVSAQVGLLTTFQIQDLLKSLFFQFNSSVESTDSDVQIEADLNESLDKFLGGASVAAGAGNTVSMVVNEGRNAFFFAPEVIDEIESFTFVNNDPVSPICQDLAGTVFSKDDPNMDRYSPPLHHNCKSILVPNLKGSNKEIDEGGLKPSKASLEQYITLDEAGPFAIQRIEVAKSRAATAQEAQRLAQEVTVLEPGLFTVSEVEEVYRFDLLDPSQITAGTLKSFVADEGITVSYGRRLIPVDGPLNSDKI